MEGTVDCIDVMLFMLISYIMLHVCVFNS